MTHKNCLNCGKDLTDKYCSGCGQKADTHRISFKHFILHDVLHGTFHIEKGMLFTAKQALVRPGKAALDYISGKRIRYYNVFYLILISIGVMIFTRHIGDLFQGNNGELVEDKVYLNEASERLDNIFSKKLKFILFLFVPFAALNSFVLFRRKKLNLSEHSILSGIVLLGILLFGIFTNLYFPINNFFNLNGNVASIIVAIVITSYVGFAYINAFGSDYSGLGIAYRILLFYAFISLEVMLVFLITYGIATDWKFGAVTLSPFS